jgi:hypothetical protein
MRVAQEPPAKSEKRLFGYMDKGKFAGFWVSQEIAEAFGGAEPAWWAKAALDGMGSWNEFWRTIYTDLNPSFWVRNVIRDYNSAIRRLPGASGYALSKKNFLRYYLKGLAPAARRVFSDKENVIVGEMLKGNMLISVTNPRGMAKAESEAERLLVRANLTPKGRAGMAGLLDKAAKVLFALGTVSETTTKVAAYTYLKENFPQMSREEMAHIVRQAGSPMFLRKGGAKGLIEFAFLFANAAKEGWRTEAELLTNPNGSKAEWTRKMLLYGLMPKLVMWAAGAGLLGKLLGGRENCEEQPPHRRV